MSFTKQASLLGDIDALLQTFGTEKKSEANTEAGGYQGATTHPVKDEDDRTQDAQEGARSSENHQDVKEDQGASGVDSTAEGTPGGQDKVQMAVGVTSKATGEDSANEDDYKDTKDDDGYESSSSHPARTDNKQLDGNKYSSFAKFRKQIKQAEDAASQYLATLTMEAKGEEQKKAEELQQQRQNGDGKRAGDKKAAYCKACEGDPCKCKQAGASKVANDAGQAGYDLAGVLANVDATPQDKIATDYMVYDMLQLTLETADRRAEKYASFVQGLCEQEARNKKAEDEGGGKGPSKEDPLNPPEGSSESDEDGEDAAAAEGSDAAMSTGEGEGGASPVEGGDEDAELASLLAAGEGMGAEDAAGGMMGVPGPGGGTPLAGGGDSLASAGAAGGMPGAGGMAGLDDPAILEAVLAELGVSLEDLQSAIAGKAASALADKQASKKGSSKPEKPKTAADLARYNVMRGVVQEIMKNAA